MWCKWVSKQAMRWLWRRRTTTAGKVASTAAGSVELEIIDWVKSVFQMVSNYAVLQVESFCSCFLCHPSFIFLVCLSAPLKPYCHKLFPNLRDTPNPSSTFPITLSTVACSFAFLEEKPLSPPSSVFAYLSLAHFAEWVRSSLGRAGDAAGDKIYIHVYLGASAC